MFLRQPAALYCICVGVGLLGVLGSMAPLFLDAEESLGLHVLYLLRGPEKTRADVVVVSIDYESAQALNLPLTPDKWPRRLHSRLLDILTAQQAAVVAFDLFFQDYQEATDDRAFAAAMRDAGNVVLTQAIDRQTLPLADEKGAETAHLNIERILSAIPILADAAVGQAPFPLPRVPIKLNQYWCFRPGSGNVSTLPVMALHVYAREVFADFIRLLLSVDEGLVAALPVSKDAEYDVRTIIGMIRPLHALFEKDLTLASRALERLTGDSSEKMSIRSMRLIRALIELYRYENSRYFNLYGPAGTIATIPYHRLVAEPDSNPTPENWAPLKHAAVFVGQTGSGWIKTHDGFYTTFSGKSGHDISGVEVAATAFANLLEIKSVDPLAPSIVALLLFGWGVLIAWIALQFSTAVSAAGLLLVNGIYLSTAYFQFKSNGTWYPLVVPMVLQTPVAFIAGLIYKYQKAATERENIREAFGYYLPDDVVDHLSANLKSLRLGGQVFYGVCLFTDAQNYTTLSENMDPGSLTKLMNTYYEAIFRPIKNNGGLVLQVVGDAVMALWSAPEPQSEIKHAACRAAVEITAEVDRFNRQAGPHAMPTRIGIHAGEMLLGNIGAMNHFEYRPVGDIVNTASRLEGLNKFLGTHILVSHEALGLDGDVPARSVGRYVFKGKSRPVLVYELLPRDRHDADVQAELCRIFESGLKAFQHGRWDEADEWFNRVLRIDATDGPSLFYRECCRDRRHMPPDENWDGVVRLDRK